MSEELTNVTPELSATSVIKKVTKRSTRKATTKKAAKESDGTCATCKYWNHSRPKVGSFCAKIRDKASLVKIVTAHEVGKGAFLVTPASHSCGLHEHK